MEIVESVRTERFTDIKLGQCFRYNQTYYMRIESVDHKNGKEHGNAVHMTNGLITYFKADEEVIRISCKMVVE